MRLDVLDRRPADVARHVAFFSEFEIFRLNLKSLEVAEGELVIFRQQESSHASHERQQAPVSKLEDFRHGLRQFRLSFAGAVLWPLGTTILGSAFSADPLSGLLSGKAPDVIGFALVLAGACLALFAQGYMGNSWRIGAAEDHVERIVDGGPFAISRNPVFVGQVLLFGGLFIAKPSLVQAALTASAFYAIALQVRIEEGVLLEALGEPYRVYCARVDRWVGYRSHQSGNT